MVYLRSKLWPHSSHHFCKLSFRSNAMVYFFFICSWFILSFEVNLNLLQATSAHSQMWCCYEVSILTSLCCLFLLSSVHFYIYIRIFFSSWKSNKMKIKWKNSETKIAFSECTEGDDEPWNSSISCKRLILFNNCWNIDIIRR